jgi:chromosome partitioning protein
LVRVKTISFVSGKGGTGKTTLTLLLGLALLRCGRRVRFVDLDPQRSLDGLLRLQGLESALNAEFTLVDTAPRLESEEVARAIRAADVVCIPTRPGLVDLSVTVNTSKLVAKLLPKEAKALIVLNQVRRGTTASKEAEALDPGEFAVPICGTSIALRECIQRAMRLGWKALDEAASNEILSFALSLN